MCPTGLRRILPGTMRRRIVQLAAGLLLLVVLAGCGDSGSRSGGGMMGGSGGMTNGGATGSGSGSTGAGQALFVEDCGSCHTLAAAGTGGTAGPNLDQAQPSYDGVVEVVTNGRGIMPAFRQSLTSSEIQAVARYVSTAAR